MHAACFFPGGVAGWDKAEVSSLLGTSKRAPEQHRKPDFVSSAACRIACYQRINRLVFDFGSKALIFKKSQNQIAT